MEKRMGQSLGGTSAFRKWKKINQKYHFKGWLGHVTFQFKLSKGFPPHLW